MSLFSQEVVAQGYLVTKDPSTKVGGMELGNKFWEVVVEAAVMPDEELIRPYEQYKTIGDVEGISIAWPSVLVISDLHIMFVLSCLCGSLTFAFLFALFAGCRRVISDTSSSTHWFR